MNARLWQGAAVIALLLALTLLAERFGPSGPSNPQKTETPAGFDFYVLALSWSPSYCEIEGADADRQQCANGRPYAFVVHGLWPQFEKGYPRDCQTDQPRNVPDDLARAQLDIMPSPGLVGHEWRSHGTCSGLSQSGYFAMLREAREKVVIPARFERLANWVSEKPQDVEKAFLAANPGMPADGAAVACNKRYLTEIRICMTKDLAFRACPEVDRAACRLDKAVMPPVRN